MNISGQIASLSYSPKPNAALNGWGTSDMHVWVECCFSHMLCIIIWHARAYTNRFCCTTKINIDKLPQKSILYKKADIFKRKQEKRNIYSYVWEMYVKVKYFVICDNVHHFYHLYDYLVKRDRVIHKNEVIN